MSAEVLVCLVFGYLAGRTLIRRSLNWCGEHFEELREGMTLENGIAPPATVCWMLSRIDEWMFLCVFMEWAGEIIAPKGHHIAIDGKSLRGFGEKVKGNKATVVLNVVDAETGLVLVQIPIREKTNEIRNAT
ncbi:MAG: hypothetical protein LUI07_04325 [Lachnospiraceae bacterium]|nr:hypothetical protein [Lachnospiraceae bacterium]